MDSFIFLFIRFYLKIISETPQLTAAFAGPDLVGEKKIQGGQIGANMKKLPAVRSS